MATSGKKHWPPMGRTQWPLTEHLVGLRGTALTMRVAVLSEDPVAIAAYPVITRRAREARLTRERAVRAAVASEG